ESVLPGTYQETSDNGYFFVVGGTGAQGSATQLTPGSRRLTFNVYVRSEPAPTSAHFELTNTSGRPIVWPGGLQGVLHVVHDGVSLDHGPMGDVQGREAFKGLVAQWRAAVPDVHCVVDNVLVEGDMVGWTVRTTGSHTGDGLGFPATGKRFETVAANIGRFRNGLAAEHWSEQGMLSMLAQIGLLPAPSPQSA